MIMNGMSRKRQDGNERIEYSTKDSNKRRGEVVGDSCLAFKTSCFHNVYNKPTLFRGDCVYIKLSVGTLVLPFRSIPILNNI